MTAYVFKMGSALSSVWGYTKWLLGYEDSVKSNAIAAVATPFVYKRRGSMYFDEDGDLAHEFYEEVVLDCGKPKMKKIEGNLIPQGDVPLRHPRIHVDFPVAMYEG